MNRSTLTSGLVNVRVEVPETFRTARALLGDADWLPAYEYQISRVENEWGVPIFFIHTRTNGKLVYTGVVHQYKGSIRRTPKSAFPAHARRFRVAEHTLQRLFAGEANKIAEKGWTVTVEVVAEAVERF